MYGKEVSTSLCGLLTSVSTIMREVNTVQAVVQCLTERYICTGKRFGSSSSATAEFIRIHSLTV